MRTASITDARRHLYRLVDAAGRGERVTITRYGRPVARPRPPDAAPRAKLPDLTDFRASIACSGKPLSQVAIDNRRDGRY